MTRRPRRHAAPEEAPSARLNPRRLDYEAVANRLLEMASRQSTPSQSRKRLCKVIRKLQDLAGGIFPEDQIRRRLAGKTKQQKCPLKLHVQRGEGKGRGAGGGAWGPTLRCGQTLLSSQAQPSGPCSKSTCQRRRVPSVQELEKKKRRE
ncbi:hypothetical protein P7K49_003141 [Saguinus oedipus]|uniref:Uncharacterized protein n=1 Tax=Saguinus oedipus TaxID=9490 RepID=A0ABQ9WJU5_SAGOE|nr:hypothetical protein P7K49_003141 [Saguinus oedipus]